MNEKENGATKMESSFPQRRKHTFHEEHVLYWSNLSRLNNLLIIINISMFFLTGLVARGYYYTYYSLMGLGLVALGLLIPTSRVRCLGYYLAFLLIELVSCYFLIASIVYWVRNGG